MLDLYELGAYFLKWLEPVGDWLLYKPDPVPLISGLIDAFKVGSVIGGNPEASLFMYKLLSDLSNMSIAMWIFGAGLIGLLAFKLIKFFLDVFF